VRLQRLAGEEFWWRVIEPSISMLWTEQQRLEGSRVRAQQQVDFWKAVCNKWYENYPDHGPTIVVHSSFTWDTKDSLDVLRGLWMAPAGCQQRVVLGGLESQFPINPANIRPPQPQLQEFVGRWSNSGGADEVLRRHRGQFNGPLLLALPYPTGVLGAVSWAPVQNVWQRRIRILLEGSPKKNSPIREHLQEAIKKIPGTPPSGFALACTWKKGRNSPSSKPFCGLEKKDQTLYGLAASSVFCLEPPGDSPSRSHLYVAVLSGCIPVIFDGGNVAYGADAVAQWAWRKNSTTSAQALENFLDYNTFALVFSPTTSADAVIRELMSIDLQNNATIQRLREGVDKAARHMVYKRETCSPSTDNCFDAFHSFASVVIDLPVPPRPITA